MIQLDDVSFFFKNRCGSAANLRKKTREKHMNSFLRFDGLQVWFLFSLRGNQLL